MNLRAILRKVRESGAQAVLVGVPLVGFGLWWRYPGVAGMGVALLALTGAGVVSVLSRAQVAPKRTVRPRTVQRLGACTGVVELTGTSRRFPVVFDATDEVAGAPVPVDIPLLAPRQRVKVEYPIPTHTRGLLRVGPLTLSRRGLAGLAHARTVVGDVVEVHVVPRVLPVRGLPGGVRRGHVGADERVERGGTDLVGLREYVPGDDLRRLHWATSARTGTLMIREDADPARPHLAVVLAYAWCMRGAADEVCDVAYLGHGRESGTLPWSAGNMPEMRLNSDVLPAPLGPLSIRW